MALQNFTADLDDATYQAALDRARNEGRAIEQALVDLLTTYGRGQTGLTTYTVQRGDSLATIARRFYGDPRQYPRLQQANNITDPGRIWVGQVLVIPALSGGATPSPTPPSPTPPTPSPAPAPTPSPAPAPTPSPAPTPPPTPSPPTPPSSPAPTATPTLADYVRAMPRGFRPDRAGGLRATYQFQLTGGVWTVTVANQTCTVADGQSGSPSVAIQMSGTDFIKLAQGQLNTTQAYRQGQIKIGGDLNLAARIPDLFGAWAGAVTAGSEPSPSPVPTPQPAPTPSASPTPQPSPTGSVYPSLLNASFDEYQPYFRDNENKVWKEARFPEQYGKYWTLELISERKGRIHLMDSGTFARFTQAYFHGGGHDYHIHGTHSQVVTSRYGFDLVFFQTVAAQPGRDYTFNGSIVSFYKGTSGERADGKIFKTLGLDPSGGRDWRGSNVVWGERDGTDNAWRYPSLKVKAQANAITVFIHLENIEKDVGETELNIIHLDNFKLE